MGTGRGAYDSAGCPWWQDAPVPAASAAPRFHPGPPAGPGADADRAPRSARATRRRPPRRRFVRAIRSRPPGADPVSGTTWATARSTTPARSPTGRRPRPARPTRLLRGRRRRDRRGGRGRQLPADHPRARRHRDRPCLVRAALQRTPQATEAIFLWPATRSTTSAIAGWSGSAMRPTLAPGPPPSASASPSRASSASTWWSRAATATRPGFRSSTASGRRCATRSRHGWHRRTSTPTPPRRSLADLR